MLEIITERLPNGIVGHSYEVQLRANRSDGLVWEVRNALPVGLTLSPSGLLSGTSKRLYLATIFITVTEQSSGILAGRNFTLYVGRSESLVITVTELPDGIVGEPYQSNLNAVGGVPPYTWTAEPLPTGLVLDGNEVSGTPTEVFNENVLLTVIDHASQPNKAQSFVPLMVTKDIAVLTIDTMELPVGRVDQPYAVALEASGGVPPYRWEALNLPPGLTLITNIISGKFFNARGGNVTVIVRDSSVVPNQAQTILPLKVNPAIAPLAITTSHLQPAFTGQFYEQLLTGGGGGPPYTWSAVGLPRRLSISSTHGIISGYNEEYIFIPLTVTISLTDGRGSTVSRDYKLTSQ